MNPLVAGCTAFWDLVAIIERSSRKLPQCKPFSRRRRNEFYACVQFASTDKEVTQTVDEGKNLSLDRFDPTITLWLAKLGLLPIHKKTKPSNYRLCKRIGRAGERLPHFDT